MPERHLDVSYTTTIRAQYPNRPGMLGHVTQAIGQAGGDIGAVDIVHSSRDVMATVCARRAFRLSATRCLLSC
jgi:hypothetical protein